MASQTDLDQGGTIRQRTRLFMGPSVGWLETFDDSILNVIAGGTTVVVLGATLIRVNVASLVTLTLPRAVGSPAGVQAIPSTFVGRSIYIVDYGGNAAGFNITIQGSGGELIDGLASISITTAYGAFILKPNTPFAGWTLST